MRSADAGAGAPVGAQGETSEASEGCSDEDAILTRILWLDGCEASNANTRERYIYIHGTPEEHLLGTPASHGCIRMRNADIAALFERVAVGTEVDISLDGIQKSHEACKKPLHDEAVSLSLGGNG